MNIIENGDYVLGKAKDIVNYLIEMKNKLNQKNLGDVGFSLDDYLKEEENINKVIKEIVDFDYQAWVILKLYRNEFDELDYEEINI